MNVKLAGDGGILCGFYRKPPGVTVKVNGELKGRTPLTLSQLPNGPLRGVGESWRDSRPRRSASTSRTESSRRCDFVFGAAAGRETPRILDCDAEKPLKVRLDPKAEGGR